MNAVRLAGGVRRLLVAVWVATAIAGAAAAAVPVVGCPADGQSGPQSAPSPLPAAPRVRTAIVDRLAFYAAASLAVLAPRGSHCLEMYGSGGAFLLVTPRLYGTGSPPDVHSVGGPAVELSFLNGENSGREEVAAVFSRLFPSRRRFIEETRRTAAMSERTLELPEGPYPADRTIRRSLARVDTTTPPGHEGMGTFESRLRPDGLPIEGTALLTKSRGVDSVVLLDVRLRPGDGVHPDDILAATEAAYRPEGASSAPRATAPCPAPSATAGCRAPEHRRDIPSP